ncbi:hypothetical protein C8R41DRAFT_916929 [Lentinula lateritia]|uniref:Fungal-type protein kinase domain-containing protein n=1 Tax=Lentinula lateritia TaxID=40482 RepID=A0ABQ8VNE2_9AGAR|nr:hypothetical protein C8R41DRAFT_916929 [Lentinula lateritia]
MNATRKDICTAYIALYRREEEGSVPTSFHWALCYLPRDFNDDTTKGFYVYQVLDESGIWEQSRVDHNPIRVEHIQRFHIVIKLGDISTDINTVSEFTASQPATQDDTPILETHKKWSCALWIIRVLSDLQEAELFSDIPLYTEADKVKFYRRIYSIGALASGDPDSDYPIYHRGMVKMTQYK